MTRVRKRHNAEFKSKVAVEATKANSLMPVIKRKIKPDSVVYTDSYRSYNALDVSDFKHFRINLNGFLENTMALINTLPFIFKRMRV